MVLESVIRRWLPDLGMRLAVPAVLVLAATIGAIVFSLAQVAREANHIEDSLTERYTVAAVTAFSRSLGKSNADYAEWDDAVRNLYGSINAEFVEQNFVATTASAGFFDTVFLLDENGKDVFGYRDGQRAALSSSAVFGASLSVMVSRLPRDGHTYAVETGIVKTPWGLAAVAAGPVVPNTAGLTDVPSRARILVLAKRLDDAAVADLGEGYVINQLRLTSAGKPGGVALTDPNGITVGHLVWSPRRLGSQAQARVGPAIWAMLTLLSLTMLGLIVVAVHGVREVSRRQQLAHFAATHDSLTGLPNRAAFVDVLETIAADPAIAATPGSVVYFDLDGFKEVNDAFGHATGDALLRMVAKRFRATGANHFLARVGGDEFALLITGADAKKEADGFSRRFIDMMKLPFDIDGRRVVVGTSLGIAHVAEPGLSPQELLRRADVAMYQAKQSGTNRYLHYDAALDRLRHEKIGLAIQLRRALEDNELSLAYQPVFDALSGRIVAAEALLRWNNAEHGPVPPSEFIPLAEEIGVIEDIGAWALRRAASDAARWPDVRLAVNISPTQFQQPDFSASVSRILSSAKLQPGRLEIELTEGYFLAQPERALAAIEGLRRVGVTIALDDFGTGYSSIGYLRRFKFDKVKLDRSLVLNIVTEPETQQLVQATVALATALGLRVTAEGVETTEQATILRAAGCHELQGFLFAMPMSAAAFTDLFYERQAQHQSVFAA